eukprot:6224116-Prymnesium_polylepis.1
MGRSRAGGRGALSKMKNRRCSRDLPRVRAPTHGHEYKHKQQAQVQVGSKPTQDAGTLTRCAAERASRACCTVIERTERLGEGHSQRSQQSRCGSEL